MGFRRNDRCRRDGALRVRRRHPPRGDRKTSPNDSAPIAPTSSSTSPKVSTERIARPTSPRSASSSTSRTPAATRSRSRCCLHKARTKDVLTAHGIPNASFSLIESEAALETLCPTNHRDRFVRLFLKPVQEGSSKGITERNLVRTRDELVSQARFLLDTYAQPVIAETFLPGAEFTCGVLGNGATAEVLPHRRDQLSARFPPGAVPIYGYEAKWIWDTPSDPLDIFECPARIDARLQAAIEDVVLRAYRVLGCRDWSRIDVRLDAAGVPNIVEVNPLPGILPNPEDNSCLPKAARAAGLIVRPADSKRAPARRRAV